MSRFDDLLRQSCSAGVVHKSLGDVAGYSSTRIDAADLDAATFVGVDNLLPDKMGRTDSSYVPGGGRVTRFEAGDVLLGNIRPYLKKVWRATFAGGCSNDVLAIRVLDDYRTSLTTEFLYYLLSSDWFFAHNMKHAKGAKMPRGSKPDIMRFRIPIPPVAVQHAIVDALDTFAKLEVELEAEWDGRRRQYDYYRDKLLSFTDAETQWAQVGAVGSLFGGLVGKSKSDFTGGAARYVSYLNVFNNITTDLAASDFVRVDKGERQRRLQRGDILFTGSSETADACGMSSVVVADPSGRLYLNSFCIGYRLNDPDLLSPEFAKHLFRSAPMRKQIVRTANGVTRFNVSKRRLAKVRFPVPPLEQQRRIAQQLDMFHALANDLSIGLPAELAARRKQFEHYRARLLTFKEAAA